MEKEEILVLADKVKRISHRVKNADNFDLYKKGILIARRIKRGKTLNVAVELLEQFNRTLAEEFIDVYPTSIARSADITSMSDTYTADDAKAASDLKSYANDAFAEFPNNCSGSVADVANQGFDISDLDGKKANEQVDYMSSNWETVDAKTAQDLANKGELVIAGLKNPNGDGHVAVVVPGTLEKKPDGISYPFVQGGGSSTGRSNGNRTAGDVWPASPNDPEYRGNVKYYKPK